MNVSLSILFSLMMGLAFLGIGLIPEPKTSMLGLLWGNILLVTDATCWPMGAVTLLFLACLGGRLQGIQDDPFQPTIAASVGIRTAFSFTPSCFSPWAVVSVNLIAWRADCSTSLLINRQPQAPTSCIPPGVHDSHRRRARTQRRPPGLLCSYYWAFPTGASIVICSSLEFALSRPFSPKRGRFQGPGRALRQSGDHHSPPPGRRRPSKHRINKERGGEMPHGRPAVASHIVLT